MRPFPGFPAGLRGSVLLLAIGLTASAVSAADDRPLNLRILDARTAWVVNDGASTAEFQRFLNALKGWNRFRVVATQKEADLVIMLSRTAPTPGVASPFRAEGSSGVLWMKVLDANSDRLLWSEKADSPTRLVSSLKKRVQETEERRRERQRPPVSPVG